MVSSAEPLTNGATNGAMRTTPAGHPTQERNGKEFNPKRLKINNFLDTFFCERKGQASSKDTQFGNPEKPKMCDEMSRVLASQTRSVESFCSNGELRRATDKWGNNRAMRTLSADHPTREENGKEFNPKRLRINNLLDTFFVREKDKRAVKTLNSAIRKIKNGVMRCQES
jgi:hypothetical protein